MNEIQIINDLIQNCGFPIACVLGLGYYVKYLTDTHKKEIETLRQALDNNTQIITKLYERFITIDGGDSDE